MIGKGATMQENIGAWDAPDQKRRGKSKNNLKGINF
jgi:hypothetical protein